MEKSLSMDAMLTPHETLRQVVFRLFPDPQVASRLLARRGVLQGVSGVDFEQRRLNTEPIIQRSVRLLTLRGNNILYDTDDDPGAGRVRPATIDTITDVVYREYCNETNAPPIIKRTKTPYVRVHEGECARAPWEEESRGPSVVP